MLATTAAQVMLRYHITFSQGHVYLQYTEEDTLHDESNLVILIATVAFLRGLFNSCIPPRFSRESCIFTPKVYVPDTLI